MVPIEINGQLWTIHEVELDEVDGESTDLDGVTLFDESEVRVFRGLSPRDALETFIHELLHVRFPDMSHAVLTPFANELQTALWKLGYRRQQP